MKKAAVLGLGIIGSRASACLQNAGWEVACWNRTPKALPGEVATPEEAVRDAEIISIYLKDAPTVREIFARIAPELKPGQIVINHATIDLVTTLWLDNRCQELGCKFLDSPFTGSKNASAGGQLVYYLGGDEALIEQVTPYLQATSKSLLHCGKVGAGTVVKVATNLITASTVQALAEGLAVAVKHGVAADAFIDAVSQNASASVLAGMKLPAMASGDYDTHFSLENMLKDSKYALDLAGEAGIDAPGIKAVSTRMQALCDSGLGGLDFAAMAKPYLTDS
ncbi:NAD(P)-dependent oxidoreductase [Luteolibacter pohnpeiensis]|uniref:NAD(P)-dependent oxidoreductase n=1 Tax=Luteolibacter pohnpeiensis TaxID=454153 RepID=A0A934S5F1_9BACT|nr:NAD(P)-dependent oxidoreductase [Luteolibacter pohnpeiensis]MBK1881086.1 NAD(P)-dependent oxidoreductase [Luteolibacter pohnpeiensis]